jgi:hypothetical protein
VGFYFANKGAINMPYYEKEQIARAREMDLLTYLKRNEPNELIHDGGGTYRTRSHDSLKISNGLWCWWSRGIGGRTALDFLVKVRGMDFTEAVRLILQDKIVSFPAQSRSPPVQATSKAFTLPERSDNNRRVFSYLCSRGIDPEIINHCIRHGKLYEERDHHNAVFVGFDGDQKSASLVFIKFYLSKRCSHYKFLHERAIKRIMYCFLIRVKSSHNSRNKPILQNSSNGYNAQYM